MRILIIHNYSGRYAFGGDANVMKAEARLLASHGQKIRQYECTNAEKIDAGFIKKTKAFFEAPWSKYGYNIIR